VHVECKSLIQLLHSEMLKVGGFFLIQVHVQAFNSYWNLFLHLGWLEKVILNCVTDARYIKPSLTFLLGEMCIAVCPILASLTLASTAR